MPVQQSERETAAYGTKRERILRAAARCFNEKGYSGTSLKDVATQLGMTDAALYYYVDSKAALVYQCYLRAAAIGARTLQEAIDAGGSGYEVAFDYLQRHVAAHCGDEGPIAIMSEIPSLSDPDRDDILQRSRQHSRAFENLLRGGIEDGSIRDCDVRMTGNAIMGAINWIPKWFHGDPAVARDLQRTFPDFLMRGLRC